MSNEPYKYNEQIKQQVWTYFSKGSTYTDIKRRMLRQHGIEISTSEIQKIIDNHFKSWR